MTAELDGDPRPVWSRPREAVALLLRGATAAAVWRVALVVGTILSAANQGTVILSGQTTWATWARVAFNFVVPYVVASTGFLAACRAPSTSAAASTVRGGRD